jgi:hypothetical protein
MIISKSKNFVYIHIEKCGGTSIEYALEPCLLPTDILLGSTPKGERLEYSFFKQYGYKDSLKKHSSAQEIKKYLNNNWDNMYKFTTVRNPKNILISLYYYSEMIIQRFIKIENIKDYYENKKFPTNWNYEMPYILDYCESVIDKTFIDGFIYKVINNKRDAVIPQTNRIDESIDLYDLNNISTSWKTILNNININKDIQLNVINKSIKPNNVILNNESIEIIKNHYQLDYSLIPNKIKTDWK